MYKVIGISILSKLMCLENDIAEEIIEILESENSDNYIVIREGVSLVSGIVDVVLGILLVATIVLLPFLISIEISYINFPLVREGLDKLYERIEGKAPKLLGFILRDAKRAIALSDTEQVSKSPNWIYLKIKCKFIFICVFIIGFIAGGPAEAILNIIWETVRKVISMG